MVRAERGHRRVEKGKLPEDPEFRNFSYVFSRHLLTYPFEQGKRSEEWLRDLQADPDNRRVNTKYVEAFTTASEVDRNTYWQEKAPSMSYGQRMVNWLSGLETWLSEQDESVQKNVKSLLIFDRDIAKLREQDSVVSPLVSVINKDEQLLDLSTMSDTQLKFLQFYDQFLTTAAGRAGGQPTGMDGLVAQIVQAAIGPEDHRNNLDEAIQFVEKLSPFMQTVGIDAKHGLAAMIVSEIRAELDQESLVKENLNTSFNQQDNTVWTEFFEPHANTPRPESQYQRVEPLKPGEKRNIVEVLTELQPPATKAGNPYWVEGEVPADIPTAEELKQFEQRVPLFRGIPVQGENGQQGLAPQLNPDAFKPGPVLENNLRFVNTEQLIGDDGGVLGLSAASAEIPEQQAALYRGLGSIILEVHKNNPKLLEDFLQAQDELSREVISLTDGNIAEFRVTQTMSEEKFHALDAQISSEFVAKFGQVDQNNRTDEQNEFIRRRYFELTLPQRQDALKNFSQFPERVVSVALIKNPDNNQGPLFSYQINVPETVAAWPERVKALEQALSQEKLELTPEQMRQIEFLSHSVDVVKVIQWIQMHATVSTNMPQTPDGEAPFGSPPIEPIEPREPVGNPMPGPLPDDASHPSVSSIPSQTEALESTISQPVDSAEHTENEAFNVESFFSSLQTPANNEDSSFVEHPETLVVHTSNPYDSYSDIEDDYMILGRGGHEHYGVYAHRASRHGVDIQGLQLKQPFIAQVLKNGSRSEDAHTRLFQEGQRNLGQTSHFDSTILPFAAKSADTSQQQRQVFVALSKQVIDFYQTYPKLRKRVKEYLADWINGHSQPTYWPQEKMAALFKEEGMEERLNQLQQHITEGNMTFDDVFAISILALPFELSSVLDSMRPRRRGFPLRIRRKSRTDSA